MIKSRLLQQELTEKKWKNIKLHPEFKSITRFDIIDEKKSWYLADWFLLIKEFKVLDGNAADKIVNTLNNIEDQERSWWKAKVFFIFVLADKVDP